MKTKKSLSWAVSTVLVACSAPLLAPAVAHAQVATTTTTVSRPCTPYSSGNSPNTKTGETISIVHPTQVQPNEVFSVTVTPGPIDANGRNTGRISWDFLPPAGVELLEYKLLDEGVNLRPGVRIDRVGADRRPSPTGNALRIWGGNTTGPGVNSVNMHSGFFGIDYDWDASLRNDSKDPYTIPRFELTLRAPDNVGTTMAFGLPGAGRNGSQTDGNANSLTFMDTNGIGSQSYSFYCGASQNAANLASTGVAGEIKIGDANLTLEPLPAEVESGKVFTAEVSVASYNASSVQLAAGRVEIVTADGQVVGSAPVSSSGAGYNASGTAQVSVSLPPLAAGETQRDDQLFARYVGGNRVGEAQSGTSTVSVLQKVYTKQERQISLNVTEGALSGGNRAVTVDATVSGGTLPAGAQVELVRNGTVVKTSTVGADGRVQFTDSAPQRQNDAIYTYEVRLVEQIVGDDRYFGTSPSKAILVQGFNPTSDLTPGYDPATGTGSIANIFSDPNTFWDTSAGSLGALGALSVQMTANP